MTTNRSTLRFLYCIALVIILYAINKTVLDSSIIFYIVIALLLGLGGWAMLRSGNIIFKLCLVFELAAICCAVGKAHRLPFADIGSLIFGLVSYCLLIYILFRYLIFSDENLSIKSMSLLLMITIAARPFFIFNLDNTLDLFVAINVVAILSSVLIILLMLSTTEKKGIPFILAVHVAQMSFGVITLVRQYEL
jgi:hypothetical protein